MRPDTLDVAEYLDAVHAIVVDVDHEKLRRIDAILDTGTPELPDEPSAAATAPSNDPRTWDEDSWGMTEEAQRGMAAALTLTGGNG